MNDDDEIVYIRRVCARERVGSSESNIKTTHHTQQSFFFSWESKPGWLHPDDDNVFTATGWVVASDSAHYTLD